MKANCTICCDLFDDVVSIAATSCGHTFHEVCLLQWVEHSRTCPACRKHVSSKNIIRLFFTVTQDEQLNADKVKNELDTLKAEMKVKQMEQRKLMADMDELRTLVVKAELRHEDATAQMYEARSEVSTLKMKLKTLTKQLSGLQGVQEENVKLKQQLQHLKTAETIINGCDKDINEIMQQFSDTPSAKKQMATYCALLKMELQKVGDCKRQLQEEVKTAKKELGLKTTLVNDLKVKMKRADRQLDSLLLQGEVSSSGSQKRMDATERSPLPRLSTFNEFREPLTKRPKINILSPTQSKLKEDMINRTLSAKSSFFKPRSAKSDDEDGSSVLSVGYDGMGGHGRHIVRTANPLLRVKTRKQVHSTKDNLNGTIHSFLSTDLSS